MLKHSALLAIAASATVGLTMLAPTDASARNGGGPHLHAGRIVAGNRFEVIADSKELIAPVPFPDLRTRTEWEAMLEGLFQTWHGNWANPAKPRFAH